MSEEREATPGEQAAQVYADESSTSSSLEPAAVGSVLDELLEGEDRMGTAAQSGTSIPATRTARLVAVTGRRATIVWRGGNTTAVEATIDTDVEEELLVRALRNRDGVLVEMYEDNKPLVVGVLQKRLPREVQKSPAFAQSSFFRQSAPGMVEMFAGGRPRVAMPRCRSRKGNSVPILLESSRIGDQFFGEPNARCRAAMAPHQKWCIKTNRRVLGIEKAGLVEMPQGSRSRME